MRTAIVALVLLSLPLTVSGQQYDGYLDFTRTTNEQIRKLEPLTNGDMAAERQVVVLQWLIDLYTSVGRLDDADSAYQQILAWYPHDLGTLNAFAAFLMTERNHPQRADSLLGAANAWARAGDDRSIHRGRTFELWAELGLRQGDATAATRRARRALGLLDEEDSVKSLRILGQASLQLARYDLAARTYLQLITIEGGANREDINTLQTFISRTNDYKDGSIRDLIAGAIAEGESRRHQRIEEGGGEVVDLTTSDQVRLEATLRRGDNGRAVLYVPNPGGRRSAFTPYAQLLAIDGVTTLSVDPRGHGASRADTLLSWQELSVAHRERIGDDIVTAFAYLRELGFDDDRVTIVSAGSGCAWVEKAMKLGRLRATVAYLSPQFDERDRDLANAMAFHGDRRTLVVHGREDIASMHSLTLLQAARDKGRLESHVFAEAGHGIEVLKRTPEAIELLQRWVRAPAGDTPSQR